MIQPNVDLSPYALKSDLTGLGHIVLGSYTGAGTGTSFDGEVVNLGFQPVFITIYKTAMGSQPDTYPPNLIAQSTSTRDSLTWWSWTATSGSAFVRKTSSSNLTTSNGFKRISVIDESGKGYVYVAFG